MTDEVYGKIYAETRELYDRLSPKMWGQDYGYDILYGPVIASPSLFILGYQPRFNGENREMSEEEKRPTQPPNALTYAHETGCLANALREIWPAERMTTMMGANINFFRAVSGVAWNMIPFDVRAQMQKHSLEAIQRVVKTNPPARFLVVGLGTLKEVPNHTLGDKILYSVDKRRRYRMAQEATLWGIPTLTVTSLSGDRLKNQDRQNIYNYARNWSDI